MYTSNLPRWRQTNSSAFFWLYRRSLQRKFALLLVFLLLCETLLHVYNLQVQRKAKSQEPDRPFQHGCAVPNESNPKANATILMLARNSDLEGARHAIESLEQHFNRWFRYPVLFLNNEPWDAQFINALTNATSGEVTFDVISQHMWSYPKWIDPEAVKAAMQQQEDDSILHGGEESYHHMCRFYSGMFYDVPSVQKYRWYWRVEPNVDFTCSITYDPFIEMERRGKKYGYTIALWELGETVPSLFRLVSEYKEQKRLGTSMWTAIIDAAWLPWPFRKLLKYLPHHTVDGDFWNFCHYWSNFEIADLDFFRGKDYRDFFHYLDRSGGFYFERVSSLSTLRPCLVSRHRSPYLVWRRFYSFPSYGSLPPTRRNPSL
jgi:mannosyltransferase